MSGVAIVRETTIERTPRVMQLEGMFDVPPSRRSTESWIVNLDLPDNWNVGLIVGPSGGGKTTVARELFGQHMVGAWDWPADKSVLDGFPADMSIKDIVMLLSSVGFSSPPSWVRPFRVLSNGEQFRVTMARTLAQMPGLAVMDEFTSVVDRTVAQIGSAAIQKTVRRRAQRFIAVSCHYDIIDWLEPDWIYQPHTDNLAVGRSVQRPAIELSIRRVHHSAWQLFRKHHYLDTRLNKAAPCFVACWRDSPVAFVAIQRLPHPHSKNIMREHRLVTLPDYQGVGIGGALSAYAGSMMRGIGERYRSTTSHPAMIASRNKSPIWRHAGQLAVGSRTSARGTLSGNRWKQHVLNKRATSSFEYIGPALPRAEARSVWEGVSQ